MEIKMKHCVLSQKARGFYRNSTGNVHENRCYFYTVAHWSTISFFYSGYLFLFFIVPIACVVSVTGCFLTQR